MTTPPLQLLLVEDEAAHVAAIRRSFAATGTPAEIRVAGTLREYRELIAAATPDLALVDLNLPDGNAAEILTSPPENAPFPVLVMTAFGSEQIVVEIMKAGALDYVVKSPEAFAVLPQTVARARREWKLLQKHQQVETALRVSHARYRTLFDRANDGIFLLSGDGQLLEVNESFGRMHGYSVAEMAQMNLKDLDTPETQQRVPERFARLLAGESLTFEVEHYHKDGHVFPLEVSASRIAVGEQPLIQCFHRDITERKQAEAVDAFLAQTGSRSKAEPFFAALARFLATNLQMDYICIDRLEGNALNATTLAVWHDGHFEDNLTYALKDTPCGEVVGKTVCCYPAHVSQSFPNDAALQELRAESYVGVTLFGHAGQPIGLIAVIGRRALAQRALAEATLARVAPRAAGELERLTAEVKLRESEERLRTLIESSPEAIIVHRGGKILYVNPATVRFAGAASAVDLVGTPVLKWVHPEFRPLVTARVRHMTDTHGSLPLAEMKFLRQDGTEFEVETQATAIIYDGEPAIRVVARDLTESKRAALELRASEARFRMLVEYSPYCIHEINPAGRLMSMNAAGLKMMGVEDECAIQDLPYLASVGERDKERIAGLLAGALAGQKAEFCFQASIGSEFQSWFVPITDQQGKVQRLMGLTIDITERTRAEAALRASEARFRCMFESCQAIMLIIDPADAGIVDANPAAIAFYGWPRAELLKMKMTEINTLSPAEIAVELQSAREGRRNHFHFRHRQAGGSVRDVEAFTSPLELDGRTLIYSIVHDSTERKHAQEVASAAEAKFRAIIDVSPVAMALNDSGQRITYLNPAFVQLFGYDREDLSTLADWWPKAYPDPVYRQWVMTTWQANLEQAKQSGTAFTPLELKISCKSGATRFVLVSAAAMAEGFAGDHLMLFYDITARKQTEAALQESHARFQAISAASPASLLVSRLSDGIIRYANEQCGQMIGVAAADLINRRTPDFYRDAADRQTFIGILKAGEVVRDWEVLLKRADGTAFWTLVSARMENFDGEMAIYAGIQDITARKQAEEAIKAASEALKLSLREKEALLKEVHHRVKNNLQVITSLLRLEAARSGPHDPRGGLKAMQGRVRAMALLHEVLYRSGTFAGVDLGSYVRQIATQSFSAQVVHAGLVRLSVEVIPLQVEMDQAMPCGLLVNELVSNCLKHGFPGERSGEVRIELQWVAGGPQVRLRVSDTGVGLPADFEARRAQSLGLELVTSLVRQIRGTLAIGPGPGADFSVTFTPAASAVPPADQPKASP